MGKADSVASATVDESVNRAGRRRRHFSSTISALALSAGFLAAGSVSAWATECLVTGGGSAGATGTGANSIACGPLANAAGAQSVAVGQSSDVSAGANAGVAIGLSA